MGQRSTPIRDRVRSRGWKNQVGGTSNLFNAVNTRDPSKFIQSPLSPQSGQSFSFELSSLQDPDVKSAHEIWVRYKKNDVGGERVLLSVSLTQGLRKTIIRMRDSDVNSTWTTGYAVLTAEQVDRITDYTELRLEVEVRSLGGGDLRQLEIYWMELSIPDPGPAVQWRIWYHDFTPYSNLEGVWDLAPQEGVGMATVRDDTLHWGKRILQGSSYYWTEDGVPVQSDDIARYYEYRGVTIPDPIPKDPRADLQGHGILSGVKFGMLLPENIWSPLQQQARTDRDFPAGTPAQRVTDQDG